MPKMIFYSILLQVNIDGNVCLCEVLQFCDYDLLHLPLANNGRVIGQYRNHIVDVKFSESSQQRSDIVDVSVQCSSNGILAKFHFHNPFNGKIFSNGYGDRAECVYYNSYGEQQILFQIPNFYCGTIIKKNLANKVSHIENDIYVQLDKSQMTAGDRRYVFICHERSPGQQEIRQPIVNEYQQDHKVYVQTISIPKLTISGEATATEMPRYETTVSVLEGRGISGNPVSKAVDLGQPITLVISGPLMDKEDYKMFVHSCYAHDGTKTNKVDLIDADGCALQATISERMMRTKTEHNTVYYIHINAFRFPQSEDEPCINVRSKVRRNLEIPKSENLSTVNSKSILVKRKDFSPKTIVQLPESADLFA
ncbi:Cuticlin-1 [Trichinella nelsoni]|uniref:Cuticlin-1 n=1 Tax=Trichinella nelsoni TaxID=6336 RepID=A0A0V0RZ25_9BILA|nr:Cuticlin-1 [Trichinella nelsoni]